MAAPPSPTGWPDVLYGQLGERAGRACFRLLLLEELWVHRRVEAVHVLSPQLIRRQVSVDFTVPGRLVELLAIAERQWVVPVAALRKERLRHFDLRDEEGKGVPVLSRAQNRLVAQGALVAAARHALRHPVSPELRAAFGRIAGDDPPAAEAQVGALADAARRGDRECAVLLADEYVRFLLTDLTDNYLLLAGVDDLARRRLVKFGYDDRLALARAPTLADRLGWRAPWFTVETPASGRTASYHAEVVVPEELRVVRTVLGDAERQEAFAAEGEAERPALHAVDVPRDRRGRLWFAVRPERAGFPALAFGVTLVTALLLAAGALGLDVAEGQAGPAVSVLLAASAFFAATVAQAGEHPLVRWLFALPRLLVAFAALNAVGAAAVLAFQAEAVVVEAVWTVAAGAAAGVALVLLVALSRALPLARPRIKGVRPPADVQ